MTRSLLSFVVVASLSAWTAPARAEILDKPADIILAVKAHRSGAWLDDMTLKLVLDAQMDAKNLEEQVAVLTSEVAECRSLAETMRRSAENKDEQIALLHAQFDAEKKISSSLQEDLDAWYHNPAVLGTVGIVVGALTASLVIALRR